MIVDGLRGACSVGIAAPQKSWHTNLPVGTEIFGTMSVAWSQCKPLRSLTPLTTEPTANTRWAYPREAFSSRVEFWHVRENLWVNEISPASRRQNRHHYRGETVEIAIPGSILGSYSEEFSLTTDPVRETPVTAKGKLFSFDWFVQIELDVPWAKDPEVRPEERDGKGTITSSLGHVLFYAS